MGEVQVKAGETQAQTREKQANTSETRIEKQSRQFETGQVLAYGMNGICTVDEIKSMKITQDSKPELYYVLRLRRDDKSFVSVPVANEKLTAKIRQPMSREMVQEMLKDAKTKKMVWDSDRRARSERFREIINGGVSTDLLRMIVCINDRKRKLYKEGKKLPVTDTNTFKSAVKLFEEEVAYVIGIREEEVVSYVRETANIRYSLE